MAEPVHEGGCLCGRVRYAVSGAPAWVAHCHCQSCRRATGTVMASFAGFLKPRYAVVQGVPGAVQSSPGVRRRFCPDCGTPLTYEAERWPEETHIHLATLDQPAAFWPTSHVFTAEAMPWLKLDDGLPRYAGLSRGAAPEPATVPAPAAPDEITGGCLCGAVRYRLDEALSGVHLCHCRMCQRSTGSPFAGFGGLPETALRFTRGRPKLYRSSGRAQRGFCADCGTQLTFQYDSTARIGVTLGSLDRPEAVRPEVHVGIESRLPWIRFADGLPERATAQGACGCADDG